MVNQLTKGHHKIEQFIDAYLKFCVSIKPVPADLDDLMLKVKGKQSNCHLAPKPVFRTIQLFVEFDKTLA